MRSLLAPSSLARGASAGGRVAPQQQRSSSVSLSAVRGRKPKVPVEEAAAAPVVIAGDSSQSDASPGAAAPKRRGRKPKAISDSIEDDKVLDEVAAAVEAPPKKTPRRNSKAKAAQEEDTKSREREIGITPPWASTTAEQAPADVDQQQAELQEYVASRAATTAERRQRKKKAPVKVAIKLVTAELEEKVVVRDAEGWEMRMHAWFHRLAVARKACLSLSPHVCDSA